MSIVFKKSASFPGKKTLIFVFPPLSAAFFEGKKRPLLILKAAGVLSIGVSNTSWFYGVICAHAASEILEIRKPGKEKTVEMGARLGAMGSSGSDLSALLSLSGK